MKKFSEFAETITLTGKKEKIDSILNKEIIIVGQRITHSKYSKDSTDEYLTLQYKYPNLENLHVVFTGSKVLINQVKKYSKNIPFETKIIRINKYYTFS